MKGNLGHKAAELEVTAKDQEKTDLSRRIFLTRLTILGVGCAAAMTLGVRKQTLPPRPTQRIRQRTLPTTKLGRRARKPNSSTSSIRKTNSSSLLKRAGWYVGRRAGPDAGCAGRHAGCAGRHAGRYAGGL